MDGEGWRERREEKKKRGKEKKKKERKLILNVGDCEEFRQIVINTIVTKKIYQIGELKKFFDDVIEVNAHLGVGSLTEIVNDICKLLTE